MMQDFGIYPVGKHWPVKSGMIGGMTLGHQRQQAGLNHPPFGYTLLRAAVLGQRAGCNMCPRLMAKQCTRASASVNVFRLMYGL